MGEVRRQALRRPAAVGLLLSLLVAVAGAQRSRSGAAAVGGMGESAAVPGAELRFRDRGFIPQRLSVPRLRAVAAAADSGGVAPVSREVGDLLLDGERLRRAPGARTLEDALQRLPGVVRR
jgi:hypothetical protein